MTKKEIIDGLISMCMSTYRVAVSEITSIPDVEEFIQHSCVPTGATKLRGARVNLPNATVFYYFCPYCGKLYYNIQSYQ